MSSYYLTLTNTTPLLVGWYDPNLVDPKGIRETEIKGIWRYWSRAVIAGALYDKGFLHGEMQGSLRTLTKAEAKVISYYVGKILGLGYSEGEKAEQSRFRLQVIPSSNLSKLKKKFTRNTTQKPQRVSLLTLKDDVEYIDKGAHFILRIDKIRSKYEDAEKLALKILVLALQLQGIGKGSRRGLGSLDIIDADGFDFIDGVKGLKDLLDDIYHEASSIVFNQDYTKKCSEDLGEYCRKVLENQKQGDYLPPTVSISKKVFSVYKTNLDYSSIEAFFVRSERCKTLTGNPKCYDDIRENYAAWFLGLPRSQTIKDVIIDETKNKKEDIDTGYLIQEIERRASAVYVSYHEQGNKLGSGVYISFSLSTDWPQEMKWQGAYIKIVQDKKGKKKEKFLKHGIDPNPKTEPLKIDEKQIIRACQIVIKELDNYIYYISSKNGQLTQLWPDSQKCNTQ